MDPKSLLFLVYLLTCFSLGSTLKCYVCGTPANSTCTKAIPSAMSIRECDLVKSSSLNKTVSHNNNNDFVQIACVKVFLTDNRPSLFLRACGYYPPDVVPCDFMREKAHVSSCKTCKTDLCNDDVEEDDPKTYLVQ